MATWVAHLQPDARRRVQREIEQLAGITRAEGDGTQIRVYGADIPGKLAERIGSIVEQAALDTGKIARSGEHVFTSEEVHVALRERGELAGDAGHYTKSGWLLRLLRALDLMSAGIAFAEGASELKPPVTLGLDVAIRGGYVTAFPQNVHFTAPMHADCLDDTPRADRVEDAATAGAVAHEQRLVKPRRLVNPLLCYHVYDYLAHNRDVIPPALFTLCGPCMRVEGEGSGGLDRLEQFTMREIVVLAEAEHVVNWRARAMEKMQAMALAVGLECEFRAANDPFTGADGKKIARLQRLAGLKYELQVDLPGLPSPLAIGSANLHGDTFVSRFGIAEGGANLNTGCVGFGLERWALALMCTHGPDPGQWPIGLHEAVGS